MADGLSIAASLIVVIQLTGTLVGLGYGYAGGVKWAPKDLRDLVDELKSLSKVLITVQDYTNKSPQSPALHTLNDQSGTLQSCT